LEPIPFLSLSHQHQLIHDEVQAVFREKFESNWFILGQSLETFEKAYAQFSGVRYCLGVGNGFDALTAAAQACGLKEGDEVIVPSHTYVATWLAISRAGATVVPVEPDPDTMNINVTAIEDHITARTKAIVPVHLYGQPCDMDGVMNIAQRQGLKVIEDNAQSHGARWGDRLTGSFGDINATSFYPTKNLGALGDGGAITTNNAPLAEFVRKFRNYGFDTKNHSAVLGVNTRLDELQAAVLSIKLRYLEQWNEERSRLADHYLSLLARVGDLQLPTCHGEATHVYHLFVVRTKQRDALKSYLAEAGIDAMIHYPIPPHLQAAYSFMPFRAGDFPLAEAIANTALSLPLWPGITHAAVSRVCEGIREFYRTL
jgi:dTDP-4-amino-4,6-dideoxygalactose transaminase